MTSTCSASRSNRSGARPSRGCSRSPGTATSRPAGSSSARWYRRSALRSRCSALAGSGARTRHSTVARVRRSSSVSRKAPRNPVAPVSRTCSGSSPRLVGRGRLCAVLTAGSSAVSASSCALVGPVGRAGPAWFSASDRPATVGAWNSADTGRDVPNSSLIRLTNRVASREWPPRSKKLASTVTAERPRMSATMRHSRCSWGVRAPRPRVSAPSTGIGSALRSSFPLALSGNRSSPTTVAGIIGSARRSRR